MFNRHLEYLSSIHIFHGFLKTRGQICSEAYLSFFSFLSLLLSFSLVLSIFLFAPTIDQWISNQYHTSLAHQDPIVSIFCLFSNNLHFLSVFFFFPVLTLSIPNCSMSGKQPEPKSASFPNFHVSIFHFSFSNFQNHIRSLFFIFFFPFLLFFLFFFLFFSVPLDLTTPGGRGAHGSQTFLLTPSWLLK